MYKRKVFPTSLEIAVRKYKDALDEKGRAVMLLSASIDKVATLTISMVEKGTPNERQKQYFNALKNEVSNCIEVLLKIDVKVIALEREVGRIRRELGDR